jgi:hypothetical protein
MGFHRRKVPKDTRTEADIAKPVVAYFEAKGAMVYQEVKVGDNIIDLVVKLEDTIAVVEVKKTLSLDLLAQACNWIGDAHQIWIAVAAKESAYQDNTRARALAKQICAWKGIGILYVKPSEDVRRVLDATLNDSAHVAQIVKSLDDEHRAYCLAGTQRGPRWTPWVATCEHLRAYVKKHPGCLLSEAFANIKHHYSSRGSACQAMRKLITRKKVPGLRLESRGKEHRVYEKA